MNMLEIVSNMLETCSKAMNHGLGPLYFRCCNHLPRRCSRMKGPLRKNWPRQRVGMLPAWPSILAWWEAPFWKRIQMDTGHGSLVRSTDPGAWHWKGAVGQNRIPPDVFVKVSTLGVTKMIQTAVIAGIPALQIIYIDLSRPFWKYALLVTHLGASSSDSVPAGCCCLGTPPVWGFIWRHIAFASNRVVGCAFNSKP